MIERKIVVVKNGYPLNWLKDYGFEEIKEKEHFKFGGIIVDEKTREVYCNGKTKSEELAVLLKLYDFNIVEKRVVMVIEKETDKENIKEKVKVRENA